MSNKALIISSKGAKPELSLRQIPTPGSGQIVIQNQAFALNPVDNRVIYMPGFAELAFQIASYPFVPGNDVAGVVHTVGPDVTHFKVGDRVIAFPLISDQADKGAFQEYTLVDTPLVSRIPDQITAKQGATLPSSLVTAAGTLRDIGVELPKAAADKPTFSGALLIWGGSSSVGTAAIQVAKAAGATVIATSSPQHHGYLRELGADVTLDYKSPSIADDLKQALQSRNLTLHAAIDTVSADMRSSAAAFSAVGGGRLATMLPFEMIHPNDAVPENVDAFFSGAPSAIGNVEYSNQVMHELAEQWLVNGVLRPHRTQDVSGGLAGIQQGLEVLSKGVSCVKLVGDVY